MLTQHNHVASEDSRCQIVKRFIRRHVGAIGLVIQEPVTKLADPLAGFETAIGRNLLVIPYYQYLFGPDDSRQSP
ncbi:hypothetical protein D3C86_1844000 [compost metagenome]